MPKLQPVEVGPGVLPSGFQLLMLSFDRSELAAFIVPMSYRISLLNVQSFVTIGSRQRTLTSGLLITYQGEQGCFPPFAGTYPFLTLSSCNLRGLIHSLA